MSLIPRRSRALIVGAVAALWLTLPTAASAQGALTRVALFAPAGHSSDPTLTAALATVADSVELSLVVMQRYDVRRLPSADPDTDLPRVRSYCEANHIDQAILGSGSAKPDGGFDFRLVVYDRKTDSITIDRKGSSTGALDMFDTTDALVSSLLDGLSGTHLLFGSLSVDTDPTGATVLINGREAGTAPLALRGLPVGTIQVTARAAGREEASSTVNVADGETASASLKLARSMGTLSVQMPSDGQLTVASTEIGTKQLSGPGSLTLPTGTYQVTATSAGLATVSGQVAVTRNAAVSWLPWTKGYLDVRVDPPGSAITVDGAARGASPLIVEVEPGTTHHIVVSKDRYQAYQDDVGADAGGKTPVSAQLTGLPGVVKVTTSVAGVKVRLDDGYAVKTPATFKDVAAGSHLLTILPYQDGSRLLSAGPPSKVDVPAGDEIDVNREMKPGVARLVIPDAPENSRVEVKGVDGVYSAQAVASGIDIPAGQLVVLVTSSGPPEVAQKWRGETYADPDSVVTRSVRSFVWLTTVQPSVGSSDTAARWQGLTSFWGSDYPYESLSFKDQPGTHLAGGFVFRDDKYLYVKYVFSNGAPRTTLSAEFAARLAYATTIDTTYNRQPAHIGVEVRFQKSGAPATAAYVTGKGGSRGGLSGVSYQLVQDSLVMQIPLSDIKPYVQGPCQIALNVVDEGADGQWHPYNRTEPLSIDFGF